MTASAPPERFGRLNRRGREHRVSAAIATRETRHVLSYLAPLARRAALAALLAAVALPAAASSLSGSYLAAMQADFRDDYVEAAAYYDQALALDPANVGLLTNAVVSRMAMGDVATARPLADRLEAARATRWRRWCGSATRWPRATLRRRRRCWRRPRRR